MPTNDVVGLVKAILSADTSAFSQKFDAAADDVKKLSERLKKDLVPSQQAVNNVVREFLGGPERQRAELYAQALAKIGDVASLTAADQAKVNRAMNDALAHYKALGQETTETAQKYKALADATAGVTKSTGLFAEGWQKLAAGFTAGMVITKAIGWLTDLGQAAFENAGKLVDLREKTGLTLEYLQKLQFVGSQTGTGLEAFSDAIFKLGVNIENGGKKIEAALEKLGLGYHQIRAMRPEEQFDTIARALAAITDTAERNALGVVLLGKGYKEIAPAIREYAELVDKARIASDEQVEAAESAGDAYDRLMTNLGTLATETIGRWTIMFERWPAFFGETMSAAADAEGQFKDLNTTLATTKITLEQITKAARDVANVRDPTGGMAAITRDVVAQAQGPSRAGMAGPSTRSASDDLDTIVRLEKEITDGLDPARKRKIAAQVADGASIAAVAAAHAEYGVTVGVVSRIVEQSTKATQAATKAQEKHAESLKKAHDWMRQVTRSTLDMTKVTGNVPLYQALYGDMSWIDQMITNQSLFEALRDEEQQAAKDRVKWMKDLTTQASDTVSILNKVGGQVVQIAQAPARQFAEIWGQSISTTAAAFEGLSRQYPGLMDSGIGAGFAGGLYGAQVGLGAAAQFKAGGAQGGLEGRSQQILALLQGIMAMQAATSGEDRMGNIVGGAMTGASLGTMLPTGWGTAIGAIAGGAWGAAQPTDRQARQLREEINREVGGDRSGAGLAQIVKDVGAESERYGLIAPGMAGVQLSVQMRQFKEADTTTEVLDLADEIKKVLQDQIEQMAEIDSMLGRYGLSMDDLKTPQDKATRAITQFTEEYERLKALGFGKDKIGTAMASSLNAVAEAALDAGMKLPEAFRPLLADLARSGGLSDELKNKLLGLPEAVKTPWQEMQAVAEEFGIGLEFLGTQFQQSKLTDQATDLAGKFNLLIENGADVQIVVDKMAGAAQAFTKSALEWGLEVPVTMRPLLEKLAEQGKLTDENGTKLEDLSRLKFGQTLADELDPLLEKLDELIEVLSKDLPDALGTAGRAAANTATGPASGAGTRPDVEPGGAEAPGMAAGSGGLRNFKPSGSWAVLHGREEVLTESQGAGVAAMVRLALAGGNGGQAMNINLIQDGRVTARVVARYLPDAVREFKV